MSIPKRICAACGRKFVPDRFNVHHQKYCLHPACVRERKHGRDRKWEAKRREDPEWRRLKSQRCADCRRRRAVRPVLPSSPAVLLSSGVEHALIGLAVRLTDATGVAEAREFLRGCEEHGRRLAQGCGPPFC